ncbi:MAG: hypothetical protein U0Y68_12190 [Blastocatellia bacterium]
MGDGPKDRWDKLNICGNFLGLFMTPILAAVLGYLASDYLNGKEEIETRSRLYTELTARREEADSSLRKDMFNSIIDKFLEGRKSDLKSRVLNLELLTYNFGDSLDLGPLLEDVERQTPPSEVALKNRLLVICEKVKQRHLNVLEGSGCKRDGMLEFEQLKTQPNGVELVQEVLPDAATDNEGALALKPRDFSLRIIGIDEQARKLNVRLRVARVEKSGNVDELDREFWVSLFDFPLVENIRLPDGQRCAVVVRQYDEETAQLTLVYFPGERASIKDKPYTDEVLEKLRKTNIVRPRTPQ